VRLPDGHYRVSAARNGNVETRSVVIAAGKPEHVTFEW
jgi:hypothetical protein